MGFMDNIRICKLFIRYGVLSLLDSSGKFCWMKYSEQIKEFVEDLIHSDMTFVSVNDRILEVSSNTTYYVIEFFYKAEFESVVSINKTDPSIIINNRLAICMDSQVYDAPEGGHMCLFRQNTLYDWDSGAPMTSGMRLHMHSKFADEFLCLLPLNDIYICDDIRAQPADADYGDIVAITPAGTFNFTLKKITHIEPCKIVESMFNVLYTSKGQVNVAGFGYNLDGDLTLI